MGKKVAIKIWKYFDTMQTKTQYTKTWSTAKAVFRGKFIVVNKFTNKTERFQSNNWTIHLKKLEKETVLGSWKKEIVE